MKKPQKTIYRCIERNDTPVKGFILGVPYPGRRVPDLKNRLRALRTADGRNGGVCGPVKFSHDCFGNCLTVQGYDGFSQGIGIVPEYVDLQADVDKVPLGVKIKGGGVSIGRIRRILEGGIHLEQIAGILPIRKLIHIGHRKESGEAAPEARFLPIR